jgi:hypothetical protein
MRLKARTLKPSTHNPAPLFSQSRVSRPHAAACVAHHDAPLIDERAAMRA